MRRWAGLTGILLSLGVLGFIAYRLDLGALGRALAGAQYAYLVPLVAMGILLDEEANRATQQVRAGQVLEILTDYDGALEDLPAWCTKHGQEFVGICEDESEDIYKLYIKKLH